MNINVKSIEMHNFMSIGSAYIEFNVDGNTLIKGVNNCSTDGASSNGAGKSTLFEGIVWALTGNTIRGTKNVYNINSTDGCDCSVTLFFDYDGKDYVVARAKSVKDKSSLKVIVDGKDVSGKGIKDTEKILSEYLCDIDFNLINSVIVLGQGMPSRFTSNTPSGRKEVLENLSKSDFMIEDLKDRVSKRIEQLNSFTKELGNKIMRAETTLDIYENKIESLREDLNNTESVEFLKFKLTAINENLKVKRNKLKEHEEWLDTCTKSLSEENKKFREFLNGFYDKKDDIVNSRTNEVMEISSLRNDLNSEIKSNENEINRIKNIRDICPTCGQKLAGVEKPDITPYLSKRETLNEELSDINNKILEVGKKWDKLLKELEDRELENEKLLKEKINSLESEEKKLNECIKDLSTEISRDENSVMIIERDIELADNTVAQIKSDISNGEKCVEDLKKEIEEYSAEKDLYENRLKIQNKFLTSLKRDFRGYLLKNVIEFLNSKGIEYSSYLFGQPNFEIKLDGNDIDISFNGKPYENLSGGEKQKVDVVVQFSIRELLIQYSGFSCNLLMLDELTDNLDAEGVDKMMNFIKQLNVKSLYLISHRDDMDIPHDYELVVTKDDNGISSIA